jgi:hypothetical protein
MKNIHRAWEVHIQKEYLMTDIEKEMIQLR